MGYNNRTLKVSLSLPLISKIVKIGNLEFVPQPFLLSRLSSCVPNDCYIVSSRLSPNSSPTVQEMKKVHFFIPRVL